MTTASGPFGAALSVLLFVGLWMLGLLLIAVTSAWRAAVWSVVERDRSQWRTTAVADVELTPPGPPGGPATLRPTRAAAEQYRVRPNSPGRARRHPPRRMEQILGTIGDAFADIFSSPVLQFGLRAIGVYLVILWLATAYWAFRDMQQRSDNAILPYLASAGIILFTPLFFVLGVWVYKIVRPHEKIGEVWERNLAEEALLAEVEAIHHCPTCERRIDDEWIICPTCRTRLNRVCPNCSRLVGLDWSLCAWCGKDFERRPVVAASLGALPEGREVTGRIARDG